MSSKKGLLFVIVSILAIFLFSNFVFGATASLKSPATKMIDNSTTFNLWCSVSDAESGNISFWYNHTDTQTATFITSNLTGALNIIDTAIDNMTTNYSWDLSGVQDGNYTILCLYNQTDSTMDSHTGGSNSTQCSAKTTCALEIDDTSPIDDLTSILPITTDSSSIKITMVTNDSNAVCRYDRNSNVAYASMSTWGTGLSQIQTLTGFDSDKIFNIYFRCTDGDIRGNVATRSYVYNLTMSSGGKLSPPQQVILDDEGKIVSVQPISAQAIPNMLIWVFLIGGGILSSVIVIYWYSSKKRK